MPAGPGPNGTPGAVSELPWWTALPPPPQVVAGGIKLAARERTAGSLYLVSSGLAQVPFPFIDFALFPFAVASDGPEQDYMLNNDSFNPGWPWEPRYRQALPLAQRRPQGSVAPLSKRSATVRLKAGVVWG